MLELVATLLSKSLDIQQFVLGVGPIEPGRKVCCLKVDFALTAVKELRARKRELKSD